MPLSVFGQRSRYLYLYLDLNPVGFFFIIICSCFCLWKQWKFINGLNPTLRSLHGTVFLSLSFFLLLLCCLPAIFFENAFAFFVAYDGIAVLMHISSLNQIPKWTFLTSNLKKKKNSVPSIHILINNMNKFLFPYIPNVLPCIQQNNPFYKSGLYVYDKDELQIL